MRIDDLDKLRNVKGSVESILKTLDAFGLHWDGSVYYQSQHIDMYHDAIDRLVRDKLVYRCGCSRKKLTSSDRAQGQADVYAGICRDREIPSDSPFALRLKTDTRTVMFDDELQGTVSHNLAEQDGDFIIKRKDGIVAYQFAVVIDDNLQQVNHIVRGFDLLESTPKQIYLQQLLGLATPAYMHVPVIVDRQGYKLSKQTGAMAVDSNSPNRVIFELLGLLKQDPPLELQKASVAEQLSWAVGHWNPGQLKSARTVSL